MKSSPCACIAVAALCVLIASPAAWAWDEAGHFYIAHAAVALLPEEMPAFFRDGSLTIDHCANDPDVIKNHKLPQLRSTESPNHFIDLELLRGNRLPKSRYQYIRLCQTLGVKASNVGMLPYAITEWTQRLTVAFAEYRRWPDDKPIQTKALVYAGILAHYTGDLEQPLHTTVDYDGRVATPSSRSPHTGIHAKLDYLPTKIPYDKLFAMPVAPPVSHAGSLFDYVVSELNASHSKINLIYQLGADIPAINDHGPIPPRVKVMIIERMHAGAHFTASVFLTAWEESAKIHLPYWLDRDQYDKHFDPKTTPSHWEK